MAKQFTNAPKRPPLQGAKFGIPSPILESYAATQESSTGQVVSFTDTGFNNLDRCEVYFRGQIIRATCCHPGISDGMNVNMIEQPRGVWWATVMQKSWYSRPLLQLIQKGHGYQAAVEYLLSFGAKWRPRLIIIDKRGAEIPEPPTPPVQYIPLTVTGDMVLGYDPNSWPYDDALFDSADLNGDGFIDEAELAAWLRGAGAGTAAEPPEKEKIGHTVELIPDSSGNFGPNSRVRFTVNAIGGDRFYNWNDCLAENSIGAAGLRIMTEKVPLMWYLDVFLYSLRQPTWPTVTLSARWTRTAPFKPHEFRYSMFFKMKGS